jgi:hypothetical protein
MLCIHAGVGIDSRTVFDTTLFGMDLGTNVAELVASESREKFNLK